jgi:hypothetical protein
MSIIAIAEGIGAQANANIDASMTNGLSVISVISTYLALQEAWSKLSNQDAEDVYQAQMDVPGNPGGTAAVAAAMQKQTNDSQNSTVSTGKLDNIIQEQKANEQSLSNSMTAIFNTEEPVNQLLRATSGAIQQLL